MRKRRYGLILVCFAVVVSVLVGTASAKTWYVADDGGPGIDFTKIQEAVDAAHDGDMIFVYNGTYNENVVIVKSLTLKGEDRDTTIIDAGGSENVICVNTDDCVIRGFTIKNGIKGIRLSSSDHSTITNNNVNSNIESGILLSSSNYNNINDNSVILNDPGIDLSGSNYNDVTNNIANSNGYCGIHLYGESCYNNISNNTANLNNPGIDIEGNSSYNNLTNNIISFNYCNGIKVQEFSNNNAILNNTVVLNDHNGIYIRYDSSNNMVLNNLLHSNGGGIYLESSANNEIYHNNLIDNEKQAYDDGCTNLWDNGYPSGGNYWNNYYGEDKYSGSNQDQPGSDGIGDTPYYIKDDNRDYYPLMDPIDDISLPSVPSKATMDVNKIEQLSTNKTFIDHSHIHNFDVIWKAGVEGVQNLSTVTYTITTPMNFTYLGSLPFTQVGQNYTWELPLNNHSYPIKLDPHETVQDNPWIDIFVYKTDENENIRVNITITPIAPEISIGFGIDGQIVDVLAYPSEFDLEENFPDFLYFYGSRSDLNQNQSYNFSILVYDIETIELALYKTSAGWDHSPSYNISMPVEGLGSVTISSDNIVEWDYEPQPRYEQKIVMEFEAAKPKSQVHVHKKEYLSTSDTHIDHNQTYNFTTKWSANVWEVENLDNVTYTITTSKNLAYRSNWELYQNGTENSFILPPTIEGQNYTWVLPLKDRIGSNINFDLDSSQTVQDNPWVDMDVSTMNEDSYTRVNVTFTPVIPLDWIGLRVNGDQIVDVSGYPSEFELKILTSSYVRFESGDINQYHVYTFSVLVDNPNKVSLWIDATFGWVEEPPSNIITLSVAELGSVTVKADVPVIWEHKPTQPKRGQNIYVELEEIKGFDTDAGTYPSIMGTHNGTITPSHNVTVNKMYTYPCSGTGGHSEYVRIYGHGINESATWNGYQSGDYHYIEFSEPFTLEANVKYNYTIKTGSYPRIHHNTTLTVPDGEISCAEFIDANGKIYYNWIPAIRLE